MTCRGLGGSQFTEMLRVNRGPAGPQSMLAELPCCVDTSPAISPLGFQLAHVLPLTDDLG